MTLKHQKNCLSKKTQRIRQLQMNHWLLQMKNQKFMRGKNISSAIIATQSLLQNSIWKDMNWPTLVKNRILAKHALKVLVKSAVWRDMNWCTLEKNRILVRLATNLSVILVEWRDMKGFTQAKNHILARPAINLSLM